MSVDPPASPMGWGARFRLHVRGLEHGNSQMKFQGCLLASRPLHPATGASVL